MSEEERKAAMDHAFAVSLGEFDERLAREQVEIEKQRESAAASRGGAGGGGSGADGLQGEGGDAGQGGMPPELPPGEPGEDGSTNSAVMSGGAGNPTAGPRFPAPAGTPDGGDDDVVAKQLREAAESEKDPELRAKLWEEYRKYKARKS